MQRAKVYTLRIVWYVHVQSFINLWNISKTEILELMSTGHIYVAMYYHNGKGKLQRLGMSSNGNHYDKRSHTSV